MLEVLTFSKAGKTGQNREKNAIFLLLRGFDRFLISRLLCSGTLGVSPLFLETLGWLVGLSCGSGIIPSKSGSG